MKVPVLNFHTLDSAFNCTRFQSVETMIVFNRSDLAKTRQQDAVKTSNILEAYSKVLVIYFDAQSYCMANIYLMYYTSST